MIIRIQPLGGFIFRSTLTLTLACALSLNLCFADAPFRDISFESAQSTAKDTGKLVFVDFYTRKLINHYEILLGAEQYEQAAKIAKLAIKFVEGADAYNGLAWAGYLTGAPTQENEAQAREAYDLTQGKEIDIVDTLIRILHSRGKTEEACELLQEHVAKIEKPGQESHAQRTDSHAEPTQDAPSDQNAPQPSQEHAHAHHVLAELQKDIPCPRQGDN